MQKITNAIKSFIRKLYSMITRQIDARPFTFFVVALSTIILLIIIGNIIRRPMPPATPETTKPKQVQVMGIGESAKVAVSGKIDKSGIITIFAQSPGVVQKIQKSEGDTISKGQQLISLSTNYQGGTAQSVSRKISQKNYDLATTSAEIQTDLIGKRREVAETVNEQSNELREISAESLSDTRSLVDLNDQMLTQIDAQLTALESSNVNGANDTLILQTRQAKAGLLAGQNQLRSALRNAEYQTDEDNEPQKLADIQKDLTLRQLELEEKSLTISRDIAGLSLQLSRISESLMYPSSPVTGNIQRIYVTPGQLVNPGERLALIKSNSVGTSITVLVPRELAEKISLVQPSVVKLDGEDKEIIPRYVSTEAVEGQLFSIVFDLGQDMSDQFTDNASVPLTLTLGSEFTSTTSPFIPLDAVYRTQNDSFVYLAKNEEDQNRVEYRNVTLGNVVGGFVEITEGLVQGDQVILNRNVSTGDSVQY